MAVRDNSPNPSRRRLALVVVLLVLGLLHQGMPSQPTGALPVPTDEKNTEPRTNAASAASGGPRDPEHADAGQTDRVPSDAPISRQPEPTLESSGQVNGADVTLAAEHSGVFKPVLPVEGQPACFPACYPLSLRSGGLWIARKPDYPREPSVYRTSAVRRDAATGRPVFAFPPSVKRVAIDVGTNAEADSLEWWGQSDLGFVWFEPIVSLHTHGIHLKKTRLTQAVDSNRVVSMPAAVGPKPGHMAIWLSAIAGCTSLLEMNDAALKDPSIMKGSFVGRDSAFRDYSQWKGGFTGCLEKKNSKTNREVIPVVRGEDVMALVPTDVEVAFLATDAQGFDLHVVSSFGASLRRAHVVVVECQDLPFGSGMFLTRGAFSCADIIECMKEYAPEHVLVDPKTGNPSDACPINNPSHERNCVYRNPSKPMFTQVPKLLQRPTYKIKHPAREELHCPSLSRPEGLSIIDEEVVQADDSRIPAASSS